MGDDNKGQTIASRRRLLKTIGAGAVASGLAGCSGSDDTQTATGTGTPTTASTATETGTATEDGATGSTAGLDPCLYEASSGEDSPTEISGAITEDRTLGSDTSEYLVTESLTVEGGATLTIESGTRLRFQQGTYLTVYANSALTAEGTCGEPIVFTGDEEIPGYWLGIQFDNSVSTDNVLRYCVVEYAGSSDVALDVTDPANLAVYSGSRVTVENSAIREGDGYGVILQDQSTTLASFENNAVTSNADGAVRTHPKVADGLSDTSTYTGNEEDVVQVFEGTIPSGEATTWEDLGVPYRVAAGSPIYVHDELEVAAGATVSFENDAGLEIEQGDEPGRLVAEGTESDRITFTGEQETRGYWGGIEFVTSNDVQNSLQYCDIEYGGAYSYDLSLVGSANLTVWDGSRIAIDNCTISDADGFGIFLSSRETTVDSFENNELTNNADGAAKASVYLAQYLSDTSTYTGNDDDIVMVPVSTLLSEESATWDGIDVRYRVGDESPIRVYGDLTIEAGATVSFGQSSSLEIEGGQTTGTGQLVADGTADEQITFTAENEEAGYWNGIEFYNTDRDNSMEQCVVEYGGGAVFGLELDRTGNVVVWDESDLSITDCTLRDSDGFGFLLIPPATATTSGLSYSDNAQGSVPS